MGEVKDGRRRGAVLSDEQSGRPDTELVFFPLAGLLGLADKLVDLDQRRRRPQARPRVEPSVLENLDAAACHLCFACRPLPR